jgi:hypothetical protein
LGAIDEVLTGAIEDDVLSAYEWRFTDSVERVVRMHVPPLYRLENVFTSFVVKRELREKVVRILQCNLSMSMSMSMSESLAGREMIALMEATYERVMEQPDNLLRPGALSASTAARARLS